MARRSARFFAFAFAFFLFLGAAMLAHFSYTRFYKYQSRVDQIVRAIPVEDRLISAEARDVFVKLDGEAMPSIASRCLLYQVAPAPVRMSEWHVRGLIWQTLLPTRLSEDEILAVYTNCMFFGEGRGVSFGAQSFYEKRASDLTTREAIELGRFSGSRRPLRGGTKIRSGKG